MTPTDPTAADRVVVANIEATPLDVRPSRKLGETTTVELLFDVDPELQLSSAERYTLLKRYQTFAGEASYGTRLGGEPYIRERPSTNWPVESHIVPVVYGNEITDRSFWGVIVSVDDSTQTLGGPPDLAYGVASYGSTAYGESTGDGSDRNVYRLDIEIARLARLEDYNDRDELLDDLSPNTIQL